MDAEQVKKAIEYWQDSAEYDLDVADVLLEKGKYHYSLFFGHLSLEKILKAIFVKFTSEHAPITHSLPLLAQKSGLNIDPLHLEKLAEFMEFYLGGRYPRDMEMVYKKFDRSFTKKKLAEIKETFQWLKKKL
ncbi:MAG: HEPN domain-containing protein [Acidobacteria bacterium]|nr:HEPN domain-containing protein [Acidobacteriota bacterium]MBU4404743.1 HEPN domain-containing protein [Acidobacteriota bacterium]MBU4408640.1 HEPN domain-containing protein [Pseudomonadota bacterium]MCG2810362.1 HEPN domain-containing protein [Candidatus Aminicenantes bacterium]